MDTTGIVDFTTALNYEDTNTLQPQVDWLWRYVLAFGEVAVIQGRTGVGKTELMFKIAADLSNGIRPPTINDLWIESRDKLTAWQKHSISYGMSMYRKNAVCMDYDLDAPDDPSAEKETDTTHDGVVGYVSKQYLVAESTSSSEYGYPAENMGDKVTIVLDRAVFNALRLAFNEVGGD